MSSSSSISNLSEQRWVDQISKHFSTDVDPKPCVFRVPDSLIQQNSEAYAPRNFRLGPYQHNLMSDLYDAQKIEALKKQLLEDHFRGFKTLVVDKLKRIEPAIRACYDQFLDLDGETLVWILAIDGTYLLHLLSSFNDDKVLSPEDRNFAGDIIMLENQIPSLVLKNIKKSLGSSDKEFLEFAAFSRVHSPLPVQKNIDITGKHLLDYMYNSISQCVHNEKVPEKKTSLQSISPAEVGLLSSPEISTIKPSLPTSEAAVKALEALSDVLRGTAAQKPITFLASLPWQMCLGLFNRIEKPSLDEIRVPSVTRLHKVAKVKFELTLGGLRGLKFNQDKRTLHLPKISLNADSEIILRNLVAYEAAAKATGDSKSEIADYVDLMCGIIDTAEDAELLKQRQIIVSDLGNEEIAKIFNGIIKSSRMKGCLEEITKELNELYDNTYQIRIGRFIKEHIIPSESCIKVWGVIFQILVVLLLSLAAYCDVFGCRARNWFG